jgi:hypothetical protein
MGATCTPSAVTAWKLQSVIAACYSGTRRVCLSVRPSAHLHVKSARPFVCPAACPPACAVCSNPHRSATLVDTEAAVDVAELVRADRGRGVASLRYRLHMQVLLVVQGYTLRAHTRVA